MEIKNQVKKIDSLVAQGAILDAVKVFFAPEVTTSDYGGVTTIGKTQMLEKMEGFTNAIKKVHNITHHLSLVDNNISTSEFTFHFDMKDNSVIHWHELIKRVWNDQGQVVSEEYFNAKVPQS